jgi:hypothetical protein
LRASFEARAFQLVSISALQLVSYLLTARRA